MRRKRTQNDEPQAGNWMNTYGDLVTLLLCFFVLLFSFSTIDAAKWEALVNSFSGASGVINQNQTGSASRPVDLTPVQRPDEFEWHRPDQTDPDPPQERPEILPPDPTPKPTGTPAPTVTPTVTPEATPAPSQASTSRETTAAVTTTTARPTTTAPAATTTAEPTPTPEPEPELAEFYSELSSYFEDVSMAETVKIQYDGTQITVRLIASVIFEPGSDRLMPEAEGILNGAAAIVDDYLAEIGSMRTEGHTDNRFEDESDANDAFELAAARAVRVNRYMLNRSSLDERIASVSGHGSNQPVADNDTAEGRNQNNRVDIILSPN